VPTDKRGAARTPIPRHTADGRPSATACSPSPPRCSSWTSRSSAGHTAAAAASCLAAYLAYVVSFLTIGAAWLAHTALTDRLARADPVFLRLNLLLLLVVVFLPFPTEYIAANLHTASGERVYVTLYGLTLLAIRVLGSALDAYARHEHL
jgi:uncharacterized membrane protein